MILTIDMINFITLKLKWNQILLIVLIKILLNIVKIDQVLKLLITIIINFGLDKLSIMFLLGLLEILVVLLLMMHIEHKKWINKVELQRIVFVFLLFILVICKKFLVLDNILILKILLVKVHGICQEMNIYM